MNEAFELNDKIKVMQKEFDKEQKKQVMKIRESLYYDKKGFDIPFQNVSNNQSLGKYAEKNLAEISKFINKDKLVIKQIGIDLTKGREKAARGTIWINNKTPDHMIGHEYGHLLEDSNNDVHKKVYQFLQDRTKGESEIQLNKLLPDHGYGSEEYVKKDKFIEPYMGKSYTGKTNTEILSMGLQMIMEDPYRLAIQDPEYFDLIIGILHGVE